jgi:undecaprenyl diphosphate synthase
MKIPTSIGMIMDGNRRYAKEHGLPLLGGHEAGKEKLKEVVSWCKEAGVKNLIVFAFSTENWNRSDEEVGYLMKLLKTTLGDEAEELRKEGARLRFAGQKERFDAELQKIMNEAEEKTKDGEVTLWLALSYGGRAEILNAVKNIAAKGLKSEEITEESFSNELWTAGMPDPDIILRTSGEKRLSGFLPWQGVYSELFFIDTYWPAFSKEEFDAILREYDERERRFGK